MLSYSIWFSAPSLWMGGGLESRCVGRVYVVNGAVRVARIYRVSQEECVRLRDGVPYVKVYRYNPKHLCPKLNGYGDNGQRSLKLWQLLHIYWLPNTYSNWQEYVVSVMLISVLNIKLTCEWQKAIKLNYKNTRTHVIVVLTVPSTIHENAQRWRNMADCAFRYKPTT